MKIDMGTTLGILLGICAIVLFFWERTSRRERDVEIIKSQMDTIFENSKKLLEDQQKFSVKAKELADSHHLRPELSIFVTKQWDFVEKTFHNRFEKHSICRCIVTNHINSNSSILLDSGSTIDLITFELLSSDKNNVNVLSNNVFAAMHLIGDKRITFRLLPGVFNDRFAATYSEEALNQIKNQDFDAIVLATTALGFNTGVMVHSDDNENLSFKYTVLNHFEKSKNTRLIIAADATKFLGDKAAHTSVLEIKEWGNMLSNNANRIFIVTSPPRSELDAVKRAEFEGEIEKFRGARVRVDNFSLLP